jgi:hypothetical protein
VAYKVLFNDFTELSSAIAGGGLKVVYRPGEWSEAPVGGLLAFDELPDAEVFLASLVADASFDWIYSSYQIWEIEAEDPVRLPGRRICLWLTPENASRLWGGDKSLLDDPNMGLGDWPSGTTAYRRCKPVRMVRDGSLYRE